MRQYLPYPADDVDPAVLYDDMPARGDGRPWVRVTMIASVDGATAIDGVSGGLGNDADRRLFRAVRSLADAIVVGAATARAEGYGPAVLTPELCAARQGRGQPPVPPIAVVTRSCNLDWGGALFTQATERTIVVTSAAAPAERRAEAEGVADVIVAGDDEIDLGAALREMTARRGVRTVTAEGGPTLNGALAAQGLVDELCLTVSPRWIGGYSKRLSDGPVLPEPALMNLHSLCRDGDHLFLRYRR